MEYRPLSKKPKQKSKKKSKKKMQFSEEEKEFYEIHFDDWAMLGVCFFHSFFFSEL